MKILVINPNTNPKNTRVIEKAIQPFTPPNCTVDVVNPEKGPLGLESNYHNFMAAVETHKMIKKAEEQGYDGVVIACYGDPGIEAAKELVNIPVVGITEASYALAPMLGSKFLVLVSADTAVPRQVRYLKTLGISDHLYAIKPLGVDIIGIMSDLVNAKELIANNTGKLLKETNTEVIVMGCSGFSGMRTDLEKYLNVPIIDPVVAGVQLCSTLINMKLAQSKVNMYKIPPEFEIKE